jgi:hypothetical protein
MSGNGSNSSNKEGLPQRQASMDIDQPTGTENGHDTANMDVDASSSNHSRNGPHPKGAGANAAGVPPPTSTAVASSATSNSSTITLTLDCYPYTFTPLLLFAPETYFDKGYSNYNSVAQFFSSVMPVDMLDNVLYERRNLLYEELLAFIIQHESFVTCCIDSHFTAMKVIHKNAAIFYDPTSPRIKLVTGDNFRTLALYLLIKCNYGDSEHVRDNKDHYVNSGIAVRKSIYNIWKNINRISSVATLTRMTMTTVDIDTDRYFFINNPAYPTAMTTQRTGNTCYFQVYLYVVVVVVLFLWTQWLSVI